MNGIIHLVFSQQFAKKCVSLRISGGKKCWFPKKFCLHTKRMIPTEITAEFMLLVSFYTP